jgi:hypothetical protein
MRISAAASGGGLISDFPSPKRRGSVGEETGEGVRGIVDDGETEAGTAKYTEDQLLFESKR